MSRPLAPIICDGPGCGKHKQEANHWWTIIKNTGLSVLVVAGTVQDIKPFMIGRPTFDDLQTVPVFDACGQDCALKIVSEQMGKVTS